jgi:hypothetical protein
MDRSDGTSPDFDLLTPPAFWVREQPVDSVSVEALCSGETWE